MSFAMKNPVDDGQEKKRQQGRADQAANDHYSQGDITVTLSEEQLSIADTGSGIPEKDLPHIYNRSYTTKQGGTGLGLNLVKRIRDRFDWHIIVTSSEGEGINVQIDFTS